MLDQERTAYIAFLDLKRSVGDWKQVAEYAQKILAIDEKALVVRSISEVSPSAGMPTGLRSAQDLIRKEAEAIAQKRKKTSTNQAPSA